MTNKPVAVAVAKEGKDEAIAPPVALRKNFKTNDGRDDHYHWIRAEDWPNVNNKEVLDYLKEENKYVDSLLSATDTKRLFEEIKSRIQEKDKTVPYFDSGFEYYSYILPGQQYYVHARVAQGEGKELVILDENLLADNRKYLNISAIKMSPDHCKVAYLADHNGEERYTCYIKDLDSGLIIDSEVNDIIGNIEWDQLNKGFFYTPAGESWRPNKVYYHEIGKSKAEDRLIYCEVDCTFWVSIKKSSSKEFIFCVSKSSQATECRFIKSNDIDQEPVLIHGREHNHIYDVAHHGGDFFIRINDQSPNFRVVKAAVSNLDTRYWEEIASYSDEYIKNIYTYSNHLAFLVLSKGLGLIRILDLKSGDCNEIKIDDAAYNISVIQNTFEESALRYVYSSLKRPKTFMDHNFETKKERVLKVQEIPSGFDTSKYELERIWVEADDGAQIPVSVLYSNQTKIDGSAPLYLYGYGAYGSSVPDSFRLGILSLVDRGFVYAIAHIRGGDELGKKWHEDAKFLKKKTTFTDFITCAEKLIDEGYASAGKIVISGGSAGGMLIGACINSRPELYKAAVANVPFVDVLSTMLDESLPLTPGEFKEWGDPKKKEFYDYIKSYSPYDNVESQDYPNLFVTAGLSDPRVGYWEPAKWVAKIRHMKTDDNLIVFKTDLNSGHAGASGRYDYLQEVALEYNFILKVFECNV